MPGRIAVRAQELFSRHKLADVVVVNNATLLIVCSFAGNARLCCGCNSILILLSVFRHEMVISERSRSGHDHIPQKTAHLFTLCITHA
jgi:hypothetical protein